MLYKKYHRNFVRQFKKGTKVNIRYNKYPNHDFIMEEPFIEHSWGINIIDNKDCKWTLVFLSGKIDCSIKIEENVIQEIS